MAGKLTSLKIDDTTRTVDTYTAGTGISIENGVISSTVGGVTIRQVGSGNSAGTVVDYPNGWREIFFKYTGTLSTGIHDQSVENLSRTTYITRAYPGGYYFDSEPVFATASMINNPSGSGNSGWIEIKNAYYNQLQWYFVSTIELVSISATMSFHVAGWRPT